MARPPTRISNRALVRRLIAQYEPRLQRAFLDSIAAIRSDVSLSALVGRLEAGDIAGAINVLRLEPAAFRALDRGILDAYDGGGLATTRAMPRLQPPGGGEIVLRWDVRNLRAERWLTEHSSTLITRIIEDQRTMVRTALTEGLAAGQNPRTTALDLVGRINRATGQREGGLLGLTAPQERHVAALRARLTSGDPAELRRVLGMSLRDRRFDATILRAIETGEPIDASMISRMVQRYKDRALRTRGEAVARTETMQAIHAARHEATHQALDQAGLTEQDVKRTWMSSGNQNVRDTHAAMHGQVVWGVNTPFVSPSGARMLHPGDTSLGAPAEEIINCVCDEVSEIAWGRGVE